MIDTNYDDVAVLIPCYNEATSIAQVIEGFRAALPGAAIYVFDNNSSDDTKQIALSAGATVRSVLARGKGNVVRRMFADVDADIYVLVDGDATYDPSSAPHMIAALRNDQLDMVVGKRIAQDSAAYRAGHKSGNIMLTGFLAMIFGRTFTDILSGYRVLSRRMVKSYPAYASGFEVETEMTIHALELRLPVAEIPTDYKSRPEGSFSKLSTYSDGLRILSTIINVFRLEKPFVFYSISCVIFIGLSLILAYPLFLTYFETGLVPRLPTAIMCSGLFILGAISFACGLILDAVARGRVEVKRLAYLNQRR